MHESEKKCIGIDVGGTSVKIGLFETDGTLLFKWEVPPRNAWNPLAFTPSETWPIVIHRF